MRGKVVIKMMRKLLAAARKAGGTRAGLFLALEVVSAERLVRETRTKAEDAATLNQAVKTN